MKVPASQPLRTISPRQLPLAVVAVCLLVPGLAGCRSDASQQDAYIRDLRMHEQQIYELQDYMTEYQELLRQQRKENAKLREQLAERTAPPGGDTPPQDEVPERSLLDPPRRESPEPLDYEPDDLPQIDPGEPLPTNIAPETPERPLPETLLPETLPETLPDGQSRAAPRDGSVRTVAASQVDLQSLERGSTAQFVPLPPPEEPADTVAIYAEQMTLEPAPGEEPQEIGLMAIVEPMTSRGTSGRFQGELSLMIVDPIAPEDGDWQIARWDYTIEEIEKSWRDPSRRVLDLPLAAPPSTPVGRPLELWVRLVPTSGEEKILSRTMIELGGRLTENDSPQTAQAAAKHSPRLVVVIDACRPREGRLRVRTCRCARAGRRCGNCSPTRCRTSSRP